MQERRRRGESIAPGTDVPSSLPGSRWGFVSGASHAAAHVSGMLALMIDVPTARTHGPHSSCDRRSLSAATDGSIPARVSAAPVQRAPAIARLCQRSSARSSPDGGAGAPPDVAGPSARCGHRLGNAGSVGASTGQRQCRRRFGLSCHRGVVAGPFRSPASARRCTTTHPNALVRRRQRGAPGHGTDAERHLHAVIRPRVGRLPSMARQSRDRPRRIAIRR